MRKVLAIFCLGAVMLGGCSRETKDEKFKRDFQLFTQKECPKFVDESIRMDSICYDIQDRTLTEYYTVTDRLDNDSIYTETLVEAYQEMLLKGLKNSIQWKVYKDEGITFRYDYRSATTGKVLLELTFTKEDYGK